jgi:opacity protein-like surface antigen
MAVCCSLAASAQEEAEDDEPEERKPRDLSYLNEYKLFEGGFALGFNATQVDGDTYAGYNKAGLHTGGIVCVHFSQTIGVSLELLYSQKGSRGAIVKESYAIGTYFDKYYLNLNYVQMPLVLYVKMHPRIDLEGGVAYSRLVTSWEYAESDQPWYVDPTKTEFNKSDFCYLVGLSYRLSRHWYGDVRYEYSIGSIRPTDRQPVPYTQYGGQYNNSFTFRLLYLL